jgi:hypothetical protein
VRENATHAQPDSPGGGFVFNGTHNIQSNVPTENVLAIFRAVKDSMKS